MSERIKGTVKWFIPPKGTALLAGRTAMMSLSTSLPSKWKAIDALSKTSRWNLRSKKGQKDCRQQRLYCCNCKIWKKKVVARRFMS